MREPVRILIHLGSGEDGEGKKESLQVLADEFTGGNMSALIQKIAEGQLEVRPMKKQKTFSDYEKARKHAEKAGLPLWDTHTLPHRYVVGHTTIDQETDFEDELAEWEQIQ